MLKFIKSQNKILQGAPLMSVQYQTPGAVNWKTKSDELKQILQALLIIM